MTSIYYTGWKHLPCWKASNEDLICLTRIIPFFRESDPSSHAAPATAGGILQRPPQQGLPQRPRPGSRAAPPPKPSQHTSRAWPVASALVFMTGSFFSLGHGHCLVALFYMAKPGSSFSPERGHLVSLFIFYGQDWLVLFSGTPPLYSGCIFCC